MGNAPASNSKAHRASSIRAILLSWKHHAEKYCNIVCCSSSTCQPARVARTMRFWRRQSRNPGRDSRGAVAKMSMNMCAPVHRQQRLKFRLTTRGAENRGASRRAGAPDDHHARAKMKAANTLKARRKPRRAAISAEARRACQRPSAFPAMASPLCVGKWRAANLDVEIGRHRALAMHRLGRRA